MIIVDKLRKVVQIIDVTIPFENGAHAFLEARTAKKTKYRACADEYRANGYRTSVDALVVGSLGGWDIANDPVLRSLNINQRYAVAMRRLMASNCVIWSKDIYVEHVSGRLSAVPGLELRWWPERLARAGLVECR